MRSLTIATLVLMLAAGWVAAQQPEAKGPDVVKHDEKGIPFDKIDPDLLRQMQKHMKDRITAEDIQKQEPGKYKPLEDWSKYTDAVKAAKFNNQYAMWWQKFNGEWIEEAEQIRQREMGRYIHRELDLVKALTGNPEPEKQELAYKLLPQVIGAGYDEVVDFLLEKIDDPPTQDQGRLAAEAAAWADRVHQQTRVLEDMLERLESEEIEQRELAILCLGKLMHPDAIDPLTERLDADDCELTERIWIYYAFAEIGSGDVIGDLEARLTEDKTMLEQVALEDVLFRLAAQPDLTKLANCMGKIEYLIEQMNVGGETQQCQKIVIDSLQDLIDDIIREMSRKKEQEKKEQQKKQAGEGEPEKKEGEKPGSGDQQGKEAKGKPSKGFKPGAYDAEGMNEGGDKEIKEPYPFKRVDTWGELPPDQKRLMLDWLTNPNVDPKYKKLLDSYFERMARMPREK